MSVYIYIYIYIIYIYIYIYNIYIISQGTFYNQKGYYYI